MRRLFLVLICPFALAVPAAAQVTYDGCVDFRGIPVASVLNSGLPDVAMATLTRDGTPVIQDNPNVLVQMAAQTRLFFYLHECGHHVLAHSFRNIPLQQEQEADCWAVRTLVSRGMLNPGPDLDAVQRDMSFSPGDWQHLPGPQRAFNLRACLRG